MASARQKKINALTAFEPRPDTTALSNIAKADLEPVYDVKGTDTGNHRRTNVFRILREREAITPNQSASGAKLVEIYATWKGVAGAPEGMEAGFVDKGRSQPELVTDRMVEAGKVWRQVMSYVGPSSARLLEALCADIVFGDGQAFGKVVSISTPSSKTKGAPVVTLERRPPTKPRWREVVERVTGETDKAKQSGYVERACYDLDCFWQA